MLAQEITYQDFNTPPQTHTEKFFFNLTEREIALMETMPSGGLGALLQRIAEAQDINQMITQVEEIVLSAVGVRSDDGKSFLKEWPDGRKVRDWFRQHAAYDVLFMKMWTDDNFMVEWMAGTFPSEYAPTVKTAANEAIAKMGAGDAARNPETGMDVAPATPPAPPTPPAQPGS